jgi:TRAP-type mannitol/chloroaromatic compound transport system permease small subunit
MPGMASGLTLPGLSPKIVVFVALPATRSRAQEVIRTAASTWKLSMWIVFAQKLCCWIDNLNAWVGRVVAWVTLGLVLVVFTDVVMRYAFRTSFVFTQELEWHLFAFIFLIGGGYTLLQDGHVRVDIVYQKLGFKARAWVNLLGVLLLLIPGCLLIIVTSWSFVYTSWSIAEGSPDPGGIPLRFLLKACVPVGFILLLLQGLSLGMHSIMQIAGRELPREDAT